VCRLLNGAVELAADDGSHPWLHRVEGYHHADLAPIQTMGNKRVTAVDRNVPVVAEMEERVV
jgi:hypothetical protein